MRTETRTLYFIDELNETARARAIDRHRCFNIEGDWFDFVMEDFAAIAGALGFTIDRRKGVFFSGFHSQGDGASFRGAYEYAPGWRAALAAYCPTETDIFAIGEALEALRDSVRSARVTTRGHYSHDGTMFAECWPDGDGEASDTATAEFTEAARRLARWLYRRLQREYEHLTGDDSVAESLLANEMEFTADGGPA